MTTSLPNEDLPLTIREAELSDLDAIVEFNLRLATESENKVLDRELVTKGVAALLRDSAKGRYFVAEAEGDIVGQIMHTREWSDWRNGDIWWLQSVYVAAPFRRRGVFRRLFLHLWEEADRSPDVVGIRLYVEADNQAAQNTYRDLGMNRPGYFVMERFRQGADIRHAD